MALRLNLGENMQVYSKLADLMKKSNYSIQEVHKRTGLSRSTISLLRYNKVARIDFASIAKLCELFHCNVGDLLGCSAKKLA